MITQYLHNIRVMSVGKKQDRRPRGWQPGGGPPSPMPASSLLSSLCLYHSSSSGPLRFQGFTSVSVSICEQEDRNHHFLNPAHCPAYSRSSINICYLWKSWIWRLVCKSLNMEQVDFCKLWKNNSTPLGLSDRIYWVPVCRFEDWLLWHQCSSVVAQLS